MAPKKVVVELTRKEAEELFNVAQACYADGEYYKEKPRQDHASFNRALWKLYAARQKVDGKGEEGEGES